MDSDPKNPFAELLAAHKKNIEALTQANQVAISGLQAVAQRQMEFIQQAMSDAAAIAKESGSTQNVRDAVARQGEIAKQAFDQSISNMRELADMLQKSNREALDVVNARIAEGLAELRKKS